MSHIKNSLSNVLSTVGGADLENYDSGTAIKDSVISHLSTNGDQHSQNTMDVFGIIEKVRD
jgi:phage baseplate assembly protein W